MSLTYARTIRNVNIAPAVHGFDRFLLVVSVLASLATAGWLMERKGVTISDMSSSGNVYNIELTMKGCRVVATLNDLPLVDNNAAHGSSFGSPLNSKLVGAKNQLKMTVMPTLLESGKLSTAEDVTFYGAIKKYGADEVSAPEAGEVIKEFTWDETVAGRMESLRSAAGPGLAAQLPTVLPLPVDVSVEFDNEGPNFGNRFLEGRVIKEEQKVLEYAIRLRDLMKKKELDTLFVEFKPKFDDYNIAYSRGDLDRKPAFLDYLNNKFYPSGPFLEFGRDDIIVKPWCGGRVWELRVKPNRAFFSTVGIDGVEYELEVFVALVEGSLRVIR